MKSSAIVLMAAALVLYFLAAATAPASGQVTEDEARQLFQRLGCTSCHTSGGTAPPFDEVVAMIESWRGQYASIDEAVASEVVVFGQKYDSYDALMQAMASFTGKTLDDIRPLYDYFLQVFQGQQAQPPSGETPGATATPTETATTPAETGQETAAQTPGATTPAGGAATAMGQPERGAGYALIAGVLLAVIVIGLALLASKRR